MYLFIFLAHFNPLQKKRLSIIFIWLEMKLFQGYSYI